MAEKKNTKPTPEKEEQKTAPEAEKEEIKAPEAIGKATDAGEATAPTGNERAPENGDAGTESATDDDLDDEPIVKSNFRKIRVKDFRGSYGNAKFDDHGVCEAIDKATYEQLTGQFPGAEVEFLD